jgi:hypothetical protein
MEIATFASLLMTRLILEEEQQTMIVAEIPAPFPAKGP